MRLVQKPDVVEWYEIKKGQRPKGGKRALIAVMRKLALGLYVVGVGEETFDAGGSSRRQSGSVLAAALSKRRRTRRDKGKRFNLGLPPQTPGFSEASARCSMA